MTYQVTPPGSARAPCGARCNGQCIGMTFFKGFGYWANAVHGVNVR
jgi:hypothetical protein